MTKSLTTKVGDVLILMTKQSFTLHAVGLVSKDDQTDFHHEAHVIHVTALDEAFAHARGMLAPGGRVFVRDLDTDHWSEIAGAQA